MNKKIVKWMMIIITFVFALPTILYFLKGNSIYDFHHTFNWLLLNNLTIKGKIINGICFFLLFSLFTFFYFKILKYHKELFKNRKQILFFILVISLLFLIILPLTSTDIFYYMGTGWSEAHYNVNPYQTSVEEVIQNNQIDNDELLLKTPDKWKEQTIVYGPLWPLICKLLTSLSFGNLTICLLIFKIVNLCLHLCNCYLIDKITHRKLFVLIYGLNPLVLFEALSNVHNDIFMIFFILLAIYFVLKKKNIWLGVLAIALSASIKYFTIFLLPFLLLYHYRKNKLWIKIVKSTGFGILSLLLIGIIYFFYIQNISDFLNGILLQQTKFTKSILLVIFLKLPKVPIKWILTFNIVLIAFISIILLLRLLKKKDSKFYQYIRSYGVILLLFIFLTITNFQIWYLMWLLPTIMWQKKKEIKTILNITIAFELGSVIYFLLAESYLYDISYLLISMLAFGILQTLSYSKNKKIQSRGKKEEIKFE